MTVGDIAAAAGLSGPAIYRHFPGKQAILAEVVRSGFDEMAQVLAADLAGMSDPAERLRRTYRDLAAFVIRRPEFGVMWRREYRHLAPEDAADLAKRMGEATDAVVAELHALRPELEAADAELVAWAALSVMGSISDHRVRLPRAALEELLAGIAMDVVSMHFGEIREDNGPQEATTRRSEGADPGCGGTALLGPRVPRGDAGRDRGGGGDRGAECLQPFRREDRVAADDHGADRGAVAARPCRQ